MLRLRHTSVTGFPRGGSLAAGHTLRPIPPHRTGRAVFPHPALLETLTMRLSPGVARLELFTEIPIPYGRGAHRSFSLPVDGRAAGSAVLSERSSDSVQSY